MQPSLFGSSSQSPSKKKKLMIIPNCPIGQELIECVEEHQGNLSDSIDSDLSDCHSTDSSVSSIFFTDVDSPKSPYSARLLRQKIDEDHTLESSSSTELLISQPKTTSVASPSSCLVTSNSELVHLNGQVMTIPSSKKGHPISRNEIFGNSSQVNKVNLDRYAILDRIMQASYLDNTDDKDDGSIEYNKTNLEKNIGNDSDDECVFLGSRELTTFERLALNSKMCLKKRNSSIKSDGSFDEEERSLLVQPEENIPCTEQNSIANKIQNLVPTFLLSSLTEIENEQLPVSNTRMSSPEIYIAYDKNNAVRCRPLSDLIESPENSSHFLPEDTPESYEAKQECPSPTRRHEKSPQYSLNSNDHGECSQRKILNFQFVTDFVQLTCSPEKLLTTSQELKDPLEIEDIFAHKSDLKPIVEPVKQLPSFGLDHIDSHKYDPLLLTALPDPQNVDKEIRSSEAPINISVANAAAVKQPADLQEHHHCNSAIVSSIDLFEEPLIEAVLTEHNLCSVFNFQITQTDLPSNRICDMLEKVPPVHFSLQIENLNAIEGLSSNQPSVSSSETKANNAAIQLSNHAKEQSMEFEELENHSVLTIPKVIEKQLSNPQVTVGSIKLVLTVPTEENVSNPGTSMELEEPECNDVPTIPNTVKKQTSDSQVTVGLTEHVLTVPTEVPAQVSRPGTMELEEPECIDVPTIPNTVENQSSDSQVTVGMTKQVLTVPTEVPVQMSYPGTSMEFEERECYGVPINPNAIEEQTSDSRVTVSLTEQVLTVPTEVPIQMSYPGTSLELEEPECNDVPTIPNAIDKQVIILQLDANLTRRDLQNAPAESSLPGTETFCVKPDKAAETHQHDNSHRLLDDSDTVLPPYELQTLKSIPDLIPAIESLSQNQDKSNQTKTLHKVIGQSVVIDESDSDSSSSTITHYSPTPPIARPSPYTSSVKTTASNTQYLHSVRPIIMNNLVHVDKLRMVSKACQTDLMPFVIKIETDLTTIDLCSSDDEGETVHRGQSSQECRGKNGFLNQIGLCNSPAKEKKEKRRKTCRDTRSRRMAKLAQMQTNTMRSTCLTAESQRVGPSSKYSPLKSREAKVKTPTTNTRSRKAALRRAVQFLQSNSPTKIAEEKSKLKKNLPENESVKEAILPPQPAVVNIQSLATLPHENISAITTLRIVKIPFDAPLLKSQNEITSTTSPEQATVSITAEEMDQITHKKQPTIPDSAIVEMKLKKRVLRKLNYTDDEADELSREDNESVSTSNKVKNTLDRPDNLGSRCKLAIGTKNSTTVSTNMKINTLKDYLSTKPIINTVENTSAKPKSSNSRPKHGLPVIKTPISAPEIAAASTGSRSGKSETGSSSKENSAEPCRPVASKAAEDQSLSKSARAVARSTMQSSTNGPDKNVPVDRGILISKYFASNVDADDVLPSTSKSKDNRPCNKKTERTESINVNLLGKIASKHARSTFGSPKSWCSHYHRSRSAKAVGEQKSTMNVRSSSSSQELGTAQRSSVASSPKKVGHHLRRRRTQLTDSSSDEDIEQNSEPSPISLPAEKLLRLRALPSSARSPDSIRKSPMKNSKKPLVPSKRNPAYSGAERNAIVTYIEENKSYSWLKGRVLWQNMEADRVCPGRSWQSMREHFKKKIGPDIGQYTSSEKSLHKFLAQKLSGEQSAVKPRKNISRKNLHKYTTSEDIVILQYVIDKRRYMKVKGNKLWQVMADKKVLKDRTWQSMKEHYSKNILKNIDSFDIKQEVKKILVNYGS